MMWVFFFFFFSFYSSLFLSLTTHADLPRDVPLFPAVSSTAAKSGLRLTCAQSCPANLSSFCVQAIGRSAVGGGGGSSSSRRRRGRGGKAAFRLPPGLHAAVENNLW